MEAIGQGGIPRILSRSLCVAIVLACSAPAYGQPRSIDTSKSTLTVRVFKSGVLSAFGHDHEISAPIARGTVDVKDAKVELNVETSALRVRDPKVSDKDREQIQAKMLGPDVLDAEHFREISFHSTGAEPAGQGTWKLTGNLMLHGATRTVSVDVREKDGRYAGDCRFKTTAFGIQPVVVAGGTVRVKDEVRIEFDIQLAR